MFVRLFQEHAGPLCVREPDVKPTGPSMCESLLLIQAYYGTVSIWVSFLGDLLGLLVYFKPPPSFFGFPGS